MQLFKIEIYYFQKIKATFLSSGITFDPIGDFTTSRSDTLFDHSENSISMVGTLNISLELFKDKDF